MRVAFDLTLADRARTGTRVYARELLTALQTRGQNVAQWRDDRLGRPTTALGRLLSGVRLARWLSLSAPRRLHAERVDVYHAPCPMAPIRSPCPVVVTLHDASDWTMARGLESFWTVYMRILGIRAIRRAQAVVVPSRVVREDAARVCGVPPARVWVTPEGVSPRFRPVAPAARAPVLARHGIREPYVLYVGMLAPRKNLTRLVEAYARVSRQLSREAGCLVLAGPEGPAAAIRALAERLSIPHRVLLPGWIRDEDLPAIYAGARCLAYPSLAEGFGLPILEAQACGTAVLTSDRSSMPEVAGDAALYVDPLSVDSIAEGLHRLLTDGVLVRELAARGLERARLFTWERTAEATEQVYRAVHARQ